MSVIIETTIGDITVDLYVKERPRASINFLKLCKMKYYNLSLFHHIQKGFIAQTGDPSLTGRGGESIYRKLYGEQARFFEAEKIPIIKHKKAGTLSMVNCGDGLIGSQFFITLGEDLDYLDNEHFPFGEVVEGFDIIVKLNDAICNKDNRPYKDIRITHTVVLYDPYDDPHQLEIPERSPSPTEAMIDSGMIGADEEIDDMQGRSMEEIEEIIQEKEAKARATILEMVGDLPDVDIAPPENVLFVCKLNPVTSDDDLEIIFSRFGKVKNCEVIRDQKSGESLQYAFVEFEDKKACEDAYFKMDNVLIDDRRIHVDFSQSVSKYKWKGKGRGVQVFDDKKKNNNDSTSGTKYAPWVKSSQTQKSSSSNPRDRDHDRNDRNNDRRTQPYHNDRDRDRGRDHRDRDRDRNNRYYDNKDEKKHQWSRSPPRYSRGHENEQHRTGGKPKESEDTDKKLLELLKKQMSSKKSSKKKSKKRSRHSSSSSDDSSNDDDRRRHEKRKSNRL